MTGRRLAPCAALALVLAGTACGYRHEPSGTALQPVYPLTVRDAANRQVVVPRLPQRVVTLDSGAARVLRALGVQARLLPGSTPLDSLGDSHPQLIVLPPTTPTSTAAAVARRLKVPTFIYPGGRLQPIEHAAYTLGVATGHPRAGQQLALRLRARRGDIARRIRGLDRPRVFVDVVGLGVPPPPQSLLATLVRLAGGRLVGTQSGTPSPVSAARLAKLDPDWYVTTRQTGLTLELLRRRPALASLRAVRRGHFLVVDERALHADERPYALLRELARKLHPDAFS